MSDYDFQTGEFTIEADGHSVELSQILLYIIEINEDLASATGIDLMSGAAIVSDTATVAAMVRHLGLTGHAYIKEVGGKAYLILKGYPGQRAVLQGTRYLTTNPQVVNMVVSPSQVASGAARMIGIAVIAYASLRVVEYILSDDDAQLAGLIGSLTTDLAKFSIAAGAGYLAAAAVGTVTTLAAGPLIAAIFVGMAASILLDRVDRHFGITESLVRAIEELIENRPRPIETITREVSRWERWMIDSALESAMRRH